MLIQKPNLWYLTNAMIIHGEYGEVEAAEHFYFSFEFFILADLLRKPKKTDTYLWHLELHIGPRIRYKFISTVKYA